MLSRNFILEEILNCSSGLWEHYSSYPSGPVSGATDDQASFAIDAVHLLTVAIELHREVISSIMNDDFAIP